ncbi:hypothetical protein EB796_010942 [Bugula neritina]|uniref:Uncharacterized protein n=1 Tax=Bugula neritina TaxID=10212 RepID=A0A7J7JYJ6_BUGNE|nr:hypothetical protein EB796_010942 [Bugula neritina]
MYNYTVYVNNMQVYRMSETVRGRALIINNNTFYESSKLHRKGSLRDVSNIRGVLALLDFEVDVRHDRTAEEMLKDIKEETQQPDNEDYGMHVTVLMSHDINYLSCNLVPVIVETDDIMERKVTETRDSSGQQEVDRRSQQTESGPRNLDVDDLLILQSCFDGRSSIRHSNYGTPFIRELVKTLYKHSSHTDLATLFYLVQDRVRKVTRKLAGRERNVEKQTPMVFSTLTNMRKILLFPKYKISPQSEI